MAETILVLGETGSGKSTSIENLPPDKTVLFNIIGKRLPWKGSMKNYTKYSDATKKGNMFEISDAVNLKKALEVVNTWDWVKYIVIDDFQYIMSLKYLEQALVQGWDKFTILAQNTYHIIDYAKNMREDLCIAILSHTEATQDLTGNVRTKIKTIGKLLDDKITIEGLFTTVLLCMVLNEGGASKYWFITQSNGYSTAKSPKDMLELKEENDLLKVFIKMEAYYK